MVQCLRLTVPFLIFKIKVHLCSFASVVSVHELFANNQNSLTNEHEHKLLFVMCSRTVHEHPNFLNEQTRT
ncbi:hypothetical protein HanRHA438_Chr05g0246371 [Helianthus annuus]|nr:hypothetical protein HanRHA438_Chr05g0246371 [Helianthus annuus]